MRSSNDLSAYKRIIRLSNDFYNKGLEQASVRDLSGAIISLKKSLGLNKKNTDARNLLGLIYYEMGETVDALAQWVISKNLEPDDNEADYFLERVQDDPAELDNMNQAVRKYNLGLEAAKQGNEDTAIIQLKKAINLNPKFLRAMQLVALLYIKHGEYTKAGKYLGMANAIDISNTTTLKYLSEIDRATGQYEGNEHDWEKSEEDNGADSGTKLVRRDSYKEDKPNVMAFVNLLIGVIIGVVVVYYLIVPTMEAGIREEYNQQKVDYSSELSTKSSTITQQEKKIKALQSQVAELEDELEAAKNVEPIYIEADTEGYNNFFDVWGTYTSLTQRDYTDEELETLALELWALDTTGIDNSYALGLVEVMRSEIYPKAARRIYKAGKSLYDEANYEQASYMLKAAVEFNHESDTALYYLGKSLQAMEKFEEAAGYYRTMLEVCPNSTLKEYIPQRLHECGFDE